MKKNFCLLLLSFLVKFIVAQTLSPLTVEKIMRDQKWIGTSPSSVSWSADGRYLFFNWNPAKAEADSVYYLTPTDITPKKASYEMRHRIPLLARLTHKPNRCFGNRSAQGGDHTSAHPRGSDALRCGRLIGGRRPEDGLRLNAPCT